MSNNIWIAKSDGTLQCNLGKEIPLDVMATELKTLGPKIIESKKTNDCRLYSSVCGAPSGQVNAYLITEEDWQILLSSVVGPNGFFVLECANINMFGSQGLTSASIHPVLVRELIGRPVRCYETGSPITKDFIHDRVNIEHDKNQAIVDIWYG